MLVLFRRFEEGAAQRSSIAALCSRFFGYVTARMLLASSAFLLVIHPGIARATLGAPAQSITTDQQVLGGTVTSFTQQQFEAAKPATGQPSTSSNSAYSVEQINASGGVTVNEYVAPGGTVFAISWRGPRHPNLSQLLGSYFGEYQAAAAAPSPQRRHLNLHTQNLIVEMSGHMRDLRGRAYIPSLLPQGVSADEIQ